MVDQAEGVKDEFTDVFSKLSELGDKPIPADLTAPAAPAKEETAADKEAAAAAVETAAAEQTQTNEQVQNDDELPPDEKDKAAAAAAAAAAEEKKPAAEAISDDELIKRLGRLIKEPPAQPQQEQRHEQQFEMPSFDFTQEEAALVADYEKEWPDVARAEATKRSREYKLLTQHIFGEVVKQLAPIADAIGMLMERTQLTDLTTSVEGYSAELVEQVKDWTAKQPAYLRSAYEHVIQNGTVDEVKDLVDRFRAETGVKGGNQATQQIQQKPAGSELPAATKQAVAKLAPVSTKRSVAVQPVQKEDFDGAFAEAAKEA